MWFEFEPGSRRWGFQNTLWYGIVWFILFLHTKRKVLQKCLKKESKIEWKRDQWTISDKTKIFRIKAGINAAENKYKNINMKWNILFPAQLISFHDNSIQFTQLNSARLHSCFFHFYFRSGSRSSSDHFLTSDHFSIFIWLSPGSSFFLLQK